MSATKPVSSEFLWTEEGDQRHTLVAELAPLLPVNRTYSFLVPDEMVENLAVGQRVRVALGRQKRTAIGYVTSIDRRPWDSTLRPIESIVDAHSFLTPHLITLGRQIAEHYACPLGRTLHALTPEAVRKESGLKSVRYAKLIRTRKEIAESGVRIGAKRSAIIDALAQATEPMRLDKLLESSGASTAILRSMAKLGWVEIEQRKELQDEFASTILQEEPAFSLNQEQAAALDSIRQTMDENRFRVTLLYGVSGSGKTEVYIHAMRRAIELGGQAILLIPEIVLTTQLVNRLATRFPRVAVVHSGLTGAERSIMFRHIASGERDVVIGTRSAVFAPCPNLKLICVDEEQEPSYKNMQAPRFHVRDVAIMRAKLLNIPVVLGSATPSIETWHRSQTRADHQRLTIPHRVRELPLPKVHLVDMRDEFEEMKAPVVVSRIMEQLLTRTLEREEQAMILMNRRGYATRVFCPACRTNLECPNCKVGLVVHTSSGHTICHYCRRKTVTPTICPNIACGAKLEHFGLGTQKVEEVIRSKFPNARLQRVDSDTMRHRSHYQTLVDDFSARKIDILVGTQMIAKGLDFPFVSLVGVMQADAISLASDFRAQERLFQLITQVAGRAGRGDAPGQVVVQTLAPDLPAMTFALNHDYEAFAASELAVRKHVGLPPFRRLARIVLSHPREETTRHEADELYNRVHMTMENLKLEHADVLGPNPAALSRLRGQYRYDLLIRTSDATTLRRLLQSLDQNKSLKTKAKSLIVDVDPVTLA